MKKSSEKVRRYVTEEIIEPKRQRRVSLSDKADFLDSIMDYIDGKRHVTHLQFTQVP